MSASKSTEVDVSVPVKKGGKKSFLAAETKSSLDDPKVVSSVAEVPAEPKVVPDVAVVPSVAEVPAEPKVVPDVAVEPKTVASVAVVPSVAEVGDSCPAFTGEPHDPSPVAVVGDSCPAYTGEPHDPSPVAVVPAETKVVHSVAVVGDSCPHDPSPVAVVPSVAVVPAETKVVDPAAGVGNSVVLGEISATIQDIASDASVSDKLLQVILDATLKKPGTGKEAVALAEYVYKKDIIPLIEKLRGWAVEELKKEDLSIAQKAWKEMNAIEKQVSGWCCVPSKKK